MQWPCVFYFIPGFIAVKGTLKHKPLYFMSQQS